VDFRQAHSPEWLDHFARLGYPDARPLAAGVEGAVYRLGGGTVAKVWGRRRRSELLLWQAFYADLAASGLPFATPVITRVEEVAGRAVTLERELPGTVLAEGVDGVGVEPAVVESMIAVLRALADVPGTPAMRAVPVLDEGRSFRGDEDFPTALIAVLERRVARSGAVLRARVPDFDRRHAAVVAGLERLDRRPETVLHGDLFAGNVLGDAAGRPVAVLDFGFLSGAGDPRFDAGVTAGITNMYGPNAAAITASLTARFAAELGHSEAVLRLYRAAYAIATSTAFTSDGSDGHFAWCVHRLTVDTPGEG
jgi:aminoglycoside phosphotransferase (APT) family kinase protein